MVAAFGATIPILGVCLGHQCIGAAYGGNIVRAGRPVHGGPRRSRHDGSSVFTGLPSPLRVARYHSLVIERGRCRRIFACWRPRMTMAKMMAVEHRDASGRGRPVPSGVGGEPARLRDDGPLLAGDRSDAAELPSVRMARTSAAIRVLPWSFAGDEGSMPTCRRLWSEVSDAGATPARERLSAVARSDLARRRERRAAAGKRSRVARDRGLTLADGLFETMRVRSGRAFRSSAPRADRGALVGLAIRCSDLNGSPVTYAR